MLTGKRARFQRDRSKSILEIEEANPVLAVTESDPLALRLLNNAVNSSIMSFELFKLYAPIVVGALVTLYCLHVVEMTIQHFVASLSKLMLLNLVLLIAFAVYMKTYAVMLFKSFNKNEGSGGGGGASFFQKKENIFQVILIILILVCIGVFYSQMRSMNTLNRKLELKKQQKHLNEMMSEAFNVDTKQKPSALDNAASLNESEYRKNELFYNHLFDTLYKFRTIKNTTRVGTSRGTCKALSFSDLIAPLPKSNSTAAQTTAARTTAAAYVQGDGVEKPKNFVIFSKIENLWVIIFKTIFVTYFVLLFFYFLINSILNYLNTLDASRSYSLVNKNIDRKFGTENTIYTLNKERSTSTPALNAANNRHDSEEEQPLVANDTHLFKKNSNKNQSTKKVSSLLSMRSEHAKSIKLLQRLQEKYNIKATYSDLNLISSISSNSDEPLRWLINEENKALINYLNVLLKNTFNYYLGENEANKDSATTSEEEFLFTSVETFPPKLTNLRNEISPNDNLTLKANIEFPSIDLTIQYKNKNLKPQQRLVDVKLVNVTAQIVIILSQNKINESFKLDISFDKNVDLKFQIQDEKMTGLASISVRNLENIIKSAIKQSNVALDLSVGKQQSNENMVSTTQYTPQKQQQQQSPSQVGVVRDNHANLNEKRLLVKLLKATNLNNCEEPFCVIELDNPLQKQITNVFKDPSALNEQFLFDVNSGSEELTFSIYDRTKDYGSDLVGEVVLPVSDLCSNMASKRIMQLHKYGSTKAGALTAEFMFIEQGATASKSGSFRTTITTSSSRQQQNNEKPQSVVVVENAAAVGKTGLYQANPYLKNYDSSDMTMTNSIQSTAANSEPPFNRYQNMYEATSNDTSKYNLQQQQQPEDSNRPTTPQQRGVINRNYLNMKPNTMNAIPVNATLTTSLINTSNGNLNAIHDQKSLNNDVKRARSISRSLKSLFIRNTTDSNKSKHKRDQSMDSRNTFNSAIVHQDVQSEINFKKSKGIGGSLKRIFSRKKPAKTNTSTAFATAAAANTTNYHQNTNEPIGMSASRPMKPSELNLMNGYPPTVGYSTFDSKSKLQQQQQQQQDEYQYHQQYYKEDTAFRKEPLILRNAVRIP